MYSHAFIEWLPGFPKSKRMTLLQNSLRPVHRTRDVDTNADARVKKTNGRDTNTIKGEIFVFPASVSAST